MTMLSWEAHPTRALIICGAGAIIGLGIAGFGLFTAKGTVTRVVPPEDIALVNQRPILETDYTAQLETQFNVPLAQATREQKQTVLHDMIREELYVQRGLELDMPATDPDTRTALVAAVEQQAAADAASSPPTDAQLHAFYDAHKDKYSADGRMTLHDLVLASHAIDDAGKQAMQSAAGELRGGAPLDVVMKKYGLAESGKVNGEEFYFAAQIHLGDTLYHVAEGMATGQVSDVVSVPDGPHVLVMVQNRPPVPESYDVARENIASDYKRDLTTKLQTDEENYLRAKAEILIRPDYQ